MASLTICQQASLDNVVFLTPVEKRLGADGGVMKRQQRFAFFGAANKEAVHMALAEASEPHVFLNGPAGKGVDLDLKILLSFFRAGGLEGKKELGERFFPGKGGDSR